MNDRIMQEYMAHAEKLDRENHKLKAEIERLRSGWEYESEVKNAALRDENNRLRQTNEVLRDELMNPRGDVQEKVLEMLGIRAKLESPVVTTGHCKEKAKPGGCQLHNLQCEYPKCDQK